MTKDRLQKGDSLLKMALLFRLDALLKYIITFSRVKETFFIAKNTVALFVQEVFIQHAETCFITLKDR